MKNEAEAAEEKAEEETEAEAAEEANSSDPALVEAGGRSPQGSGEERKVKSQVHCRAGRRSAQPAQPQSAAGNLCSHLSTSFTTTNSHTPGVWASHLALKTPIRRRYLFTEDVIDQCCEPPPTPATVISSAGREGARPGGTGKAPTPIFERQRREQAKPQATTPCRPAAAALPLPGRCSLWGPVMKGASVQLEGCHCDSRTGDLVIPPPPPPPAAPSPATRASLATPHFLIQSLPILAMPMNANLRHPAFRVQVWTAQHFHIYTGEAE
ncbi:hypothetical protein O3P69_007649 [Scylla paramamosain]|uniref:Uncharacterized protein n=1 Tax=Scylla paramamosain TaxID=85552 RepID=A0AAW0V1Q6_SCYPA